MRKCCFCCLPESAMRTVAIWYSFWMLILVGSTYYAIYKLHYVIKYTHNPRRPTGEKFIVWCLWFAWCTIVIHSFICLLFAIAIWRRTLFGRPNSFMRLDKRFVKRIHRWSIISFIWQMIQNPLIFGSIIDMALLDPGWEAVVLTMAILTLFIQVPVIRASHLYLKSSPESHSVSLVDISDNLEEV